MKQSWVVSVKTTLPEQFVNLGSLKTTVYTFESFDRAKAAFRKLLRGYAFSKNLMFDGKGNIVSFKEYAENAEETEDDDVLSRSNLMYLCDQLKALVGGEEISIDLCDEYDLSDWTLTYRATEDGFSIFGDFEGPENGYTGIITTNILSMEEEKNYYFYVDDSFDCDGCVLCIDLIRAEAFDGEK